MKPICLIILAVLGLLLPTHFYAANLAGQKWHVGLVNAGLGDAAFTGVQDASCWHTESLALPEALPRGNTLKVTQQDWNLVNCFGKPRSVRLNFMVASATASGSFAVWLADVSTGAKLPPKSITCSTNGKDHDTAMAWAWTDGEAHPANQSPIKCSEFDGVVYAAITMPVP